MKGTIEWFARNGVAANLMAVIVVVGGFLSVAGIKKEVFPEFTSDIINVSVIYPGASPEEVEEAICVRVEEAIQGVDGLKQITSVAAESAGSVSAEVLPGIDTRRALDDIKARVDAIDTFPVEAERPIVQELVMRHQVINVAVFGPADERTLKRLGEQVRDELSARPGITQVQLVSVRPYEISIEVSEERLRQFNLTFDEVADAVRHSSLDLPGGALRTAGGEILLRVQGQAYRGREFEDLVLRTNPGGGRLLLGDVAVVVDGFEDTDQSATFDGHPSVMVQVFRVGAENALEISRSVRDYVKEAQPRMPEGISLTVWQDYSQYLRSRIDLLLRNGINGFILVFIVLALFLRFRLAFWVSLSIPISFLGTLWLLPWLDVSINLLSLFAFIVVLGIVVDDAIVAGENIYTHQHRHGQGLRGSIEGTQEVSIPVIFSVLTSVAAFLPLLAVGGNTGKVLRVIPLIVIPTLLFSLAVSLWVLPHHLSRYRAERENRDGVFSVFRRFQTGFANLLDRCIRDVYRPVLDRALEWRYATVAIGVAILLVTAGVVQGGWLRFTFFPEVEGDDIAAMVTMPQGASPEMTAAAVRALEQSALELQNRLDIGTHNGGRSIFRHVLASVGEQPYRTAVSRSSGGTGRAFTGSHLGEVHIELTPSEERAITATEILNEWRKLTGEIPGAVEVAFTSALFSTGDAVNVQLAGRSMESLLAATEELKRRLGEYGGVFDIADSFRAGKEEARLNIKPEAEVLGLTLNDLARQVRQGFHGEEAQRIQRGRDDLKVMVRYPAAERRAIGDLENMRIRTPGGLEVPFSTVATADFGRGYATINRVDRQRAINVTADVDASLANAQEINLDLRQRVLPEVMAQFPGVTYTFEGERREQAETMAGLGRGFILALFLIYALLAIPFRSYLQPFIVMAAIPFGLVGAVIGHLIMGFDLTVLSTFGLVALAGVVVNGSLVLVDFINRKRAAGQPIEQAIREGGMVRFRPIWLTSLTTFAGLTPLLLERSVQAQFLIPMAISLSFGVIFATFITLLLVPAMYLILEDFKRSFSLAQDQALSPAEAD